MKATPCGYLAQLYTLQDHMNLLSRSPLFSSPCLDITPARASVIRTTPSAFDCLVSSGLSSPCPKPTPGWVTRKALMDLLHPTHSLHTTGPGAPAVVSPFVFLSPLSRSPRNPPPSQGETWQISYHSEHSTPSPFQCYFFILLVLSGGWYQLLSATSLVPCLRTPSANPPQVGYPSQCGVLIVSSLQQKQGQNITVLISAFT